MTVTWDWHGARSLLLKNLVQHQFQDVAKVREMRAAPGNLEGVAPQTGGKERGGRREGEGEGEGEGCYKFKKRMDALSPQKLSENEVEVDMGLRREEGEDGGPGERERESSLFSQQWRKGRSERWR